MDEVDGQEAEEAEEVAVVEETKQTKPAGTVASQVTEPPTARPTSPS